MISIEGETFQRVHSCWKLSQASITLAVFGTFFLSFGFSMLCYFVLVWLYNYFDLNVTDESFVDVLN